MKKVFAIVLVLVTTLSWFTACSSRTTNVDEEVKFLTFVEDEKFSWKTTLETDEGISFNCSPHYVMFGKTESGLNRGIPVAVFMIEQEYREERIYQRLSIDWDFELSTNSEIVGIQYLDYANQIIATFKVSGKKVTIPQKYQDSYVFQVVVFVEKDGKTYQGIFARMST